VDIIVRPQISADNIRCTALKSTGCSSRPPLNAAPFTDDVAETVHRGNPANVAFGALACAWLFPLQELP
jgi:hypothetical protein